MQTQLRRKRKRRVERGEPITELVKGSLNYTMHMIQRAFYLQFGREEDDLWIRETFDGHVIVSAMGLEVDEYYLVTYTRDEDGDYIFADRDEWEVVELAYRPRQPGVTERQKVQDRIVGDGVRYALEHTRCAAGDACVECREYVWGHGPFWFAEVEIPVSRRGGGSGIRKRRIFIGEEFREVTGDERKFGQQLGPVIERERKKWRTR